MTRVARRPIRRSMVVLAALLATAACGGSDDDASSDDDTTESADEGGDDSSDSGSDDSGDDDAGDDAGDDDSGDDAGDDDSGDSGSDDSGDSGSDDSGDSGEASSHVLQLVMSEESPDLVPFTAGGQGQGQVFQLIFMPLLQPDNENTIFSRLLESWEMSADATEATFVLRDDIEWSDGTPLTSADVVMSYQFFLDSSVSNSAGRIGGVLGQEAYNNGEADSIEGLVAVDDYTVKIILEAPNAPWISNIAALGEDLPILPNHVLGDVAPADILDHEYFKTVPVSSGPYKVVDFVGPVRRTRTKR